MTKQQQQSTTGVSSISHRQEKQANSCSLTTQDDLVQTYFGNLSDDEYFSNDEDISENATAEKEIRSIPTKTKRQVTDTLAHKTLPTYEKMNSGFLGELKNKTTKAITNKIQQDQVLRDKVSLLETNLEFS